MPRGTAVVGDERQHDGALARPMSLTSSPSVDAERVEVERVDVGRAPAASVASDGDMRRADGPVVQLAAHHQSIVVAVAVGGAAIAGRRRGGVGRRHGEHAVAAAGAARPRVAPAYAGTVAAMASVIASTDASVVGDVDVAEQHGELDGDHPVGPRRAGGGDLLADRR